MEKTGKQRWCVLILILTSCSAGVDIFGSTYVGAGTLNATMLMRIVVAKVRPERLGALAVGPGGQLYLADTARNQILELLPGGSFTVVAGTGKAGFSGDGGPAVYARLNAPGGMIVGANGTLYFADSGNMRVRAISSRGIISTIAGNGYSGWVNTGAPAWAAPLAGVTAVTIGPHDDLYIATTSEVLKLGSNRVLVRVVGTKSHLTGLYGIGRPATQASADTPDGLAFDRAGNLYVAGFATKTLLMVTPLGKLVLPMGRDGFYPRGDAGLVTAPDGSVIAMNSQQIVRLGPKGARTIVDFTGRHVDGISGFVPNGLAVAPNGDIYADTFAGNGVANKTALIKVRPGARVQVLWKS